MKKVFKSLVSLVFSAIILLASGLPCKSYAELVTHQLENYPLLKQSNYDCWAYSILSIYKYVYKKYAPIEMVYGAYYQVYHKSYVIGSGADIYEIENVMKYIFKDYSPDAIHDDLTSNEIKLEIDSNFPVHIGGKSTQPFNFKAHGVALMGYISSGSYGVCQIIYMNPNSGKIERSLYHEGYTNTFSNSVNDEYKWQQSVILLS